ncbi:hypothetical protein ACFSPU_05935 [Haoranjiania flava]|uniref:Glycosyl-4,4'-diaponeurosporenoate acyltransferase n=1 Tax=Haoranjiania flava TaxID=1856322 RepID=A0AAE3INN1_9BACT|nr:hypothetical protein [Haoranjiania flava]MCU7695298.1 hypothetical protein [Haoranjiania flava]
MRTTFNHILNFFWSIIAFYPLVHYWYHTGVGRWFIVAASVSIVAAFLPDRVYDLLQLSSRRSFYERLKVKTIRKFVQNGDLARKLPGKNQSHTITRMHDAKKYLLTIAMYNRFHWACFLFFLFSATHAIVAGKIFIGLLVLFANVLYNVTAIVLQQYNQLRIRDMLH